ncbi:hypothetical protein EHQ58_08165 [Leptospira ognonensis]|uniref:Uncharacterized protein n=1 Tax=Leptospira ognonensis TaxID=2484945 RepID=A0A4R9K430_9LEPT|nr:hypothetical protein [Leptospira ognonensis]TGL59710.1 hypothetical protein EHQ58_08165 [Leptospira ognonensis]
MSDIVFQSKLPDSQKAELDRLIKSLLNDVNTKITHLGINNFIRLNDEIAKILVPILEDKID